MQKIVSGGPRQAGEESWSCFDDYSVYRAHPCLNKLSIACVAESRVFLAYDIPPIITRGAHYIT